jgi:hypothetical protein
MLQQSTAAETRQRRRAVLVAGTLRSVHANSSARKREMPQRRDGPRKKENASVKSSCDGWKVRTELE